MPQNNEKQSLYIDETWITTSTGRRAHKYVHTT